MAVELTLHLKEYIQPFEKELAIRELESLLPSCACITKKENNAIIIRSTDSQDSLLPIFNFSAYWSHATIGSNVKLTRQSVAEATTGIAKINGTVQMKASLEETDYLNLMPKRRNLRYGVHGVHEYRGKYFPQLVRALLNISIGNSSFKNATVLDPMVGSGTTAVEASAMGLESIGIDMNPLSVFVAQTKVALLSVSYQDFVEQFEAALTEAESLKFTASTSGATLTWLDEADSAYIERWFPAHTLAEVAHLYTLSESQRDPVFQDFLKVTLSDILRKVSHQKEDDLRVRRTEKEIAPGDAIDIFISRLKRNAHAIAPFLRYYGTPQPALASIKEGDARDWRTWGVEQGTADCIVTSPPYATALPYLDTDRLSLIALGLTKRSNIRHRDLRMIGNREITKAAKQDIWERYKTEGKLLPVSVRQLIGKIRAANERNQVGFRRLNTPYLLAKYFLDMRECLTSMRKALVAGGDAFIVIGDNQTSSGDTLFRIKSSQYLTLIAQDLGFQHKETIPMEMLSSRDIHRKNALKKEAILHLKK